MTKLPWQFLILIPTILLFFFLPDDLSRTTYTVGAVLFSVIVLLVLMSMDEEDGKKWTYKERILALGAVMDHKVILLIATTLIMSEMIDKYEGPPIFYFSFILIVMVILLFLDILKDLREEGEEDDQSQETEKEELK